MIGSSIAHYRITAKIGEGGMGEVYRATDDRLNRDVAIKLLPASVENDPARLARFRREAQLLAALTHGNIAAIYGLEEQEGRSAIVLELVEGETLAERIARGALPVEDAREIALQIAEALEAAHEKGIVHRDLKPANVKITPDGTVKVLDFGLAKALEAESAEGDISASPTMTAAATQAGMILGTAAYMSPEQAKGKPVDRRADVWAFGCVLYEMLTGRAPFVGDGVSEVLAHVITQEPDLDALPAALPAQLSDTIRRCMRKDPRMRLPDIAAARIALIEAGEAPQTTDSAAAATPSAEWGPRLILAAVGLLAGFALAWAFLGGSGPSTQPATHFDLTLDPEPTSWYFALSPDGETLVYAGGEGHLYSRRLDGYESVQIPGTEGAQLAFFSPDGRDVGFLAAGRLKRVSLAGGLPEPLCAAAGNIYGISWSTDGTIYFSTNATNVPVRIDANGGEPTPIVVQDLEAGIEMYGAQLLPDESGLVVTLRGGSLDEPRVAVVDFEDGRVTEVARGSQAVLLGTDRLLYIQQGRAMLAPFDAGRRALSGPVTAAPLDDIAVDDIEDVESAFVALSAGGLLVYASGEILRRGEILRISADGRGEPTGLAGTAPQADSEGRRFLTVDNDQVYVTDLKDRSVTRLTFAGRGNYPFWSPDDKFAWFSSSRTGDWQTFSVAIDGQGEPRPLDKGMGEYISTSVGSDGTRMGYQINPTTNRDIFLVTPDGAVEMLLESKANERSPMLSPDGRLFAYVSDEEGSAQVYLRTLPITGRRWQVSTEGGVSPVWRRDGQALYFIYENTIYMAEVRASGGVRIGPPQPVFTHDRLDLDPWGNRSFDSLPDGELIISISEESNVTLRAILNWDPD